MRRFFNFGLENLVTVPCMRRLYSRNTYTTMKKYALLLLPCLLVACQETIEVADGPVNTSKLLISKDAMTLTQAMHADTSYVYLECGCHFNFSVESFKGDTSVIHYTSRDASTGTTRRAVDVTADTDAPAGTYSASIAVLSTGGKGTYRDTITVSYTRN
jgi:hypothetical protein